MDFVSIIYVISNIFIAVAVDKFMKVFFEKRRTSFYINIVSYILYLSVTSIAYFLFNTPILNIM